MTFADPFTDRLSAGFIISSHIITKPSIVIAKSSTFSQLHVVGFQYHLSHMHLVLLDFWTHIDIYNYSTFDSSYIMINVLLIFFNHLFLLPY